jgi:hypothetical protein
MRGMHGRGFRSTRRAGVGLVMTGLLLGAGSARAQETGQGALACYQRAEREVSLSSDQALRLCRGATSTAPAECYIATRAPATFLDTEEAIELCRCTTSSSEPVACYERAERETFLDTSEILQLCSPSLSYELLPDCRPNVLPVRPHPYGWPPMR